MAQVSCSNCGGSGNQRCHNCGGSGKDSQTGYDCSYCGGRGYNSCGRCNGSGYVDDGRSESSSSSYDSSSSSSSGHSAGSVVSKTRKFSELSEKEESFFREAYIIQKEKSYQQALAMYREFVKYHTKFAFAFNCMAQCYLGLGQLQEALDNANKAVSYKSHYVHLKTRADIYTAMGETEKADADLNKTIEDCIEAIGWDFDDFVLDFKESVFNILENRAKKGVTRAYYGLGKCYNAHIRFHYNPSTLEYRGQDQGFGVKGDLTKAREWFEKSAEAGDINGIYELGKFYYHGLGGSRNKTKGLEYVRKATKDQKIDYRAKDWLQIRFMRDVIGFKGYGEGTPAILTIIISVILWFFSFMALITLIPADNWFWHIMIPLVVIIFSVAWRHRILLPLALVLCVFGVLFSVEEATGNEINIPFIKTLTNRNAEIDNQWAVIVTKRNLMSEPNGGTVIKEINGGTFVTLTNKPSTSRKWISIEYEGDEGWIASENNIYCNAEHEVQAFKEHPILWSEPGGFWNNDAKTVISIDDKQKRITLTGKTGSANRGGIFLEAEYKGVTGWIEMNNVRTIR